MNDVTPINAPSNLEQILAVEDVIKHQLIPVDIPQRHIFVKGLYCREVVLPTGLFVTGKLHREDHLCIISKGSISILVDGEMVKIDAPATLVGRAGVKRVCYVHAETIWTNIHPNPDNETSLEVLEARYILPVAPSNLLGEPLWLGLQSQD